MSVENLDIQLLLEETVKLAIKDYMNGLDKWEGWERDVGDKIVSTPKDRMKWERLVNFMSARRFIFEEGGLIELSDIAGYDYLPLSVGEIRRLCSDTDCLKRLFPKNDYLPGQTTVQPHQDDDESDEPTDPYVLEDLEPVQIEDISFPDTDHLI